MTPNGGGHLVAEALALGAVEIGAWEMLSDAAVKALDSPLDESRVKKVQTGGRAADYLETYDVIERANEIFGFDGWSFELLDVTPVHAANRAGEPTGVLYMAKGRLTIGETVRIDVGTNDVSYRREDGNASPDSFETAIKGAVSDCLKRCFRTWGAQFGNSLYDKRRDKTPPKTPATPKPDLGICPKHNTAWVQGRAGIGHVVEGESPCLKETLLAE